MSGTLAIANCQRTVSLNLRLLRSITKAVLTDLLQLDAFELEISIVAAPEMARINKTFLNHEGSTDVITFDYAETPTRNTQHATRALYGEIFICIGDAIAQAREFRTTWQSELARYIIHGILHLQGYDDIRAADRRKMKCEEERLLKETARLFPLKELGRGSKLAA